MEISIIIESMIDFYEGNRKDINHFLKVHAYAKTIGELENLDTKTQEILEIAAIVHDIACPLCRKKYGNSNHHYQEIEGGALTEEFLGKLNIEPAIIKRVSFLVSHHHTYDNVDNIDYQILLEADFLVNADEKDLSKKAITNMMEKVFKTPSAKRLLKSIFQLEDN